MNTADSTRTVSGPVWVGCGRVRPVGCCTLLLHTSASGWGARRALTAMGDWKWKGVAMQEHPDVGSSGAFRRHSAPVTWTLWLASA
jgi:hypothetical protein